MTARAAWTRTALAALVLASCAQGPRPPAPLKSGTESCRFCRMTVSDLRFAAQVVAPGEEPLFFDDIGCLSEYLKRPPAPGSAATAYVMDHRARTWVRAASAVYTRLERLDTPMGSHVIAHADAASRDRDPDAHGGGAVASADLFGTDGPPNARR